VSEGSARAAQPYLCPFCGEEDLRPAVGPAHAGGPPVWHCRSCLRLFSLTFHGLAPREASTLTAASPAHDWSVDER
jgi:hypothetical protein